MNIPQSFPSHWGKNSPRYPAVRFGFLILWILYNLLGETEVGKGAFAQGKRQDPHSKTWEKEAVIYILEECSGKPRDVQDESPATSIHCSDHQLCLPCPTDLHIPLMSCWFTQDCHTDLHEAAVLTDTVPASLHVPQQLPACFMGIAEVLLSGQLPPPRLVWLAETHH